MTTKAERIAKKIEFAEITCKKRHGVICRFCLAKIAEIEGEK